MLSTFHVFVGAAVGTATGNPALAFAAGVASHHVMDLIPHWDIGSLYPPNQIPDPLPRRDVIFAALDNIVAVGITAGLILHFRGAISPWLIGWGALGGIAPDIWHHIPVWKNFTRRITAAWYHIHEGLHTVVPQRLLWFGLLNQVAVAGLSYWWLTILAK